MAVGLTGLPELQPVPGVRLGTVAAGLRRAGRPDLVVLACEPASETAAVFTRNRFCAAPVELARAHLARTRPRALVINSGYANAGTGQEGLADARRTCEILAGALGCRPEEVLPFSTGVIGERLPLERLRAALPEAVSALDEHGWRAAASGIMTTDTVPKGASRCFAHEAREYTVTGIAKGSGMIQPDMATLLAFVATDAAVAPTALDACLRDAVEATFNRVTVDGDTSTNDACVLLATGRAGNAPVSAPEGGLYRALRAAVLEVCTQLAQAIARDGEGATRLITVEVTGGASEADCLAVARTVANSPLVKTAVFAADPNWGRILAAVGRAPVVHLDVGRVAIAINGVRVVRAGAIDPGYREADGRAAMQPAEITVQIVLGDGAHAARVWTCDFSYDYVRINAEYRT